MYMFFFFSSRRRHTRCALVTGVQTCALPISPWRLAQARPISPMGDGVAINRNKRHVLSVLANRTYRHLFMAQVIALIGTGLATVALGLRSEEHTSELQSLMRISYAVFCLKKKKTTTSTAS